MRTVDSIKIKIGDYPTFIGKSPHWSTFFEHFTSLAELQKLDDLLVENSNHKSDLANDPKYATKCSQLYSILKHACAGGIALSKVNTFCNTKDGYLAWQQLCSHYYAKGDVQSYIKTCL